MKSISWRMLRYLVLVLSLSHGGEATSGLSQVGQSQNYNRNIPERWGGYGGTSLIAGGVFPLPCDCLSRCVSLKQKETWNYEIIILDFLRIINGLVQ